MNPQLFADAHSTHTFTEESVTPDDLRALYEAVKFGPTAMNSTPLRIVAVWPGHQRERLVAAMSEGNKAKTLAAPLSLVLAADLDFHETLAELVPHNPHAREKFLDNVHRENWARNQAWLQAGYVITGIRALGFAAGPMSGFDSAAVDAAFMADTAWKSFMVINVGKAAPDGWHPRAPRLAFEGAVREFR